MRLWLYLALVVNSIIVLAFLGYGGYTASKQTASLTKDLESNTHNMARSIAAGTANNLLEGELDKLESGLLRQVTLGSVQELLVANSQGRILVQVARGPNDQPRVVYDHISQPLDLSQLEVRTQAAYTLLLPIERGERLGWVRVTTSLSALESMRQQVWIGTLLASLLTVVLASVLLAVFLRKITAALGATTRFAGDLIQQRGISMPTSSGIVEIQQLNSSLNSASQALAEQFLALQNSESEQQRISTMLRQSTKDMAARQFALDEHAIVSITDLAGLITYANDRFSIISGYSREELIGQTHRVVKSAHHTQAFFETLWHTISLGEVWHGEICNRKKTGELYWVNATIVPLLGPDGFVQQYIAIRTDITERKQAQDEILSLNAGLEQRVQQRTEELQSQQEELRQSNEELEQKNQLLAEQKLQVEHQNREIETSRLALQERAEQLALTSKYKSEFLSNMSHELRTPLNSLLILAQILAENPEHNLSEQQIEYAKIIQGAGKDLLALINDILDLSKIESGTVTLELQDVSLADIGEQVERSFRHVAQSRGLGFSVELAPDLPPSFYTDAQRLQQVLKNLLSNAFKFTQQGQVSVRIAAVESGWSVEHDGLNRAQTVIGFFVTDTGIGLAADKQKIIFEAFQQADTGTTRKYGGTGLGLSISRELARLFGGELHLVESSPGQGSTFALYIPLRAPESGQGKISLFATETQRHKENPESKKPLDSLLGSRTSRPHAGRAQRGERSSPALPVVADDRTLLSINPAADLAGKKVLVVDDDMRNIFALTAVLERHKMVVTSAENGDDALEALGNNPDVDIVLMDIMMPGMDGYEAMRQIRQMKQFETLPMIALTAKAMQGDREQCIAAGASDYISKPVDTDQLVSLLRVWLYR